MIIDGHEHVILPTKKQLELMDKAGVEKTVLFPTTPHPENAETLEEFEEEFARLRRLLGGKDAALQSERAERANAELCSALRAHPGRFLGFGLVPLGLPERETCEFIERQIVANGLLGIGEISPAGAENLAPLFAASESFGGLPIWFHTFDPVIEKELAGLGELCGHFPKAPVILGHMGGTNWGLAIRIALVHPNVYLDLSAAFTVIAPKLAIKELPQRTLFSSDAPYGDPGLSRALVEEASPDPATARLVLGENLRALLKL